MRGDYTMIRGRLVPDLVADFFPPARRERTWGIEVIVTASRDDDVEPRDFQVELRIGELPEVPGQWQVIAATEACRQMAEAMGGYVVSANANVVANLADHERDLW